MNLISTHDFNFHPLCVRRNTTLIFLVNSQMQCSHVIQTQAQKCDGMHINFDAVYQGHSKFARETSKTQTALIGSIFFDQRNPPFRCADAQFILRRILVHILHSGTAVKRGARAQFPPKLSLNKVLNFRKFSLSSPKLRQSLKS